MNDLEDDEDSMEVPDEGEETIRPNMLLDLNDEQEPELASPLQENQVDQELPAAFESPKSS